MHWQWSCKHAGLFDAPHAVIPPDYGHERQEQTGQRRQRDLLERKSLHGSGRHFGALQERHAARRPLLRAKLRHALGDLVVDLLRAIELGPLRRQVGLAAFRRCDRLELPLVVLSQGPLRGQTAFQLRAKRRQVFFALLARVLAQLGTGLLPDGGARLFQTSLILRNLCTQFPVRGVPGSER